MDKLTTFPLVDADPYSLSDIFGKQVYSYSRAQALDDGVLIDCSSMAAEAGFTYPVALTRAAWTDCVEWADADSKRQTHQDEAGRLWDVLHLASLAAHRGGQEIRFQLYRIPRGGKGHKPRLVALKAVCAPGDDGEPCVTIMLPGED